MSNEPTVQQRNTAAAERQAGGTQARQRRETTALTPAVDVIENSQGITLYADMPGVGSEKLDIHVEAGTLTIEGEVELDLANIEKARLVPHFD